MDWIEMIHLRSHSKSDCDAAMAAFHQLSASGKEDGLLDVQLFRDSRLDNDLCIFIIWNEGLFSEGKSPIGIQLASAFSEFGQIHHSLWNYKTSMFFSQKGHVDEKEEAF